MLPVGGKFTVDASGASKLVDSLKPNIAIPMHYKIPGLSIDVADAKKFLLGKKSVKNLDVLEIDKKSLPAPTQIVVLSPKHG